MTQINSSSAYIFSGDQLKEDQNHPHLSSSITNSTQTSSSSSDLSSHVIFNKTALLHDDDHHTTGYYHKDIRQPHNQQKVDNFDLRGGSYNIENESESESGLKFSIWKEQVMETTNEINQSAVSNNTSSSIQVKWMSSKMRLMHKMKNNQTDPTATNNAPLVKLDHEDQKDQDPSSFISPMDQTTDSNTITSASNNTTIRVCSDCNTTKTPLWRSGPCGPKSLCNACGIRQRKARRAMAAAATAAAANTNGTIMLSERSPMKISKAHHKEKRSNGSKYKKRCKIAATTSHSRKELRFEEFLMSLSKNLALHRMFPQDEKEAAILLMALSCGHIHG